MVCLYCGNDTQVVNSRLQKRANSVWRRRRCTSCGAIMTTIERLAYEGSLMIRTATSHIVPFDRDQLFLSIYDACRHRPCAIPDATALTNTVVSKLLAKQPANGTIDRIDVVATVAKTLQQFDSAARVQYLAFHPLPKH